MNPFFRRRPGRWLAPLLLAGAACQRPEAPPEPADLLPQARMIALLADLHVLEARVENSRLSPDSARALYLAQQRDLLWNRQITDSAFQRSYRYYGIHGQDLSDIYGAVIDTLKRRAAALPPAPVGSPAPAPAAPPPPPAKAAAPPK